MRQTLRMNRVAICPGSFDPPTFGHLDILERTAALYDHVIVAIGNNIAKKYLFPAEERVRLVADCCAHIPNVSVQSFGGLLVEFAREHGAQTIVKGLRVISDFEYEFQMAAANRMLDRTVETVFLMTSREYVYVSSSIVKELAAMGGDVSSLVPPNVEKKLVELLRPQMG
jgi:pantetheine-phosphate adenylyltransferase